MRIPRPSFELKSFSTNQLLEELARRQNAAPHAKPDHWCEDCSHFVAWLDKPRPTQTPPENFNPCTKDHVMRFAAPVDMGDSFGFFRQVCADRCDPD